MKDQKAHFVKEAIARGKNRGILFLASLSLVLIVSMLCISQVSAQDAKPANAVGYYTENGKVIWIIPGQGIEVTQLAGATPSMIEKLYPMTPQAEATIIHQIPSSPVIIDGTLYQAKQISLFNGKRLRFITGKDGSLYAFTTSEKLEQFQTKQYGVASPQTITNSVFYKDWYYTGQALGLTPGNGLPDLSQIGFDNCISSAVATTTGTWSYIYDYANYGGDYFGMAKGSSYPSLTIQGWNDRASSIWVYQ